MHIPCYDGILCATEYEGISNAIARPSWTGNIVSNLGSPR
jgi:hypothetical protein